MSRFERGPELVLSARQSGASLRMQSLPSEVDLCLLLCRSRRKSHLPRDPTVLDCGPKERAKSGPADQLGPQVTDEGDH